jgi:PKD repeat protein
MELGLWDGLNSTNQNSVHTYSSEGIYTVNLIVSNANKTASKMSTITVLETTGSDEGSSDRYEEKSAGIISRKETGNLTKESKKLLNLL